METTPPVQTALDQLITSSRLIQESFVGAETEDALRVMQALGHIATGVIGLQEVIRPQQPVPDVDNVESADVSDVPEVSAETSPLKETLEASETPVVAELGEPETPAAPIVVAAIPKARSTAVRGERELYPPRERSLIDYLEKSGGRMLRTSELIDYMFQQGLVESRGAGTQAMSKLLRKLQDDPQYASRLQRVGVKGASRYALAPAESAPISVSSEEVIATPSPKATPATIAGSIGKHATGSSVAPSYEPLPAPTPQELSIISNGHLQLYLGKERIQLGDDALAVLKLLRDRKQDVSFIDLVDVIVTSRNEHRNHTHPQRVHAAIDKLNRFFEARYNLPLVETGVKDQHLMVRVLRPVYYEEVSETQEESPAFLVR